MREFIWIGHAPWRNIPGHGRPMGRCLSNAVGMWRACRNDGKPWWARILPTLHLALLPLAPWPVSLVWGHIVLYGWGWQVRMPRGDLLVWSRPDRMLYRSPDGTPSGASHFFIGQQ